MGTATHKPPSPDRVVTGIPGTLQDSPYLSSPIRPIPNSSYRSTGTRKSRRSTNRRSVTGSPGHSTVGSLKLSSPYSESIYSLQSLSSARSCNLNQDKSQIRCVILPDEIESLALFFGTRVVTEDAAGCTSGVENEDYDISDCDDDSTLNSISAESIGDAAVSAYISRDKNDSVLCNRKVTMSSPSHCQDKIQKLSGLSDERYKYLLEDGEMKDEIASLPPGVMDSKKASTVMDSPPQIHLPAVEQMQHNKLKTRSKKKYAANGIDHLSKSPYGAQHYGLSHRRVNFKRRPSWEP